jgi:hypothetical protein
MSARPLPLLPAWLLFAVALLVPAFRTQAGPITIKVEIEGVTQGLFDVVEGLGLPSDSSGTKPAPIILRRVYDPTLKGLWNWRRSVVEGNAQKRDGHILLFDAEGNLAASWLFRRGWPSRWEVPRLQANAQDPGEEVVEIIHEGLTLEM